MIDWFTGILPCIHRPLPAGSVVSVDADGAVEWETVKRLTVRGSYESTMKVRSGNTSLYFRQSVKVFARSLCYRFR